MDINKIAVREKIAQTIWNYFLLGELEKSTAERIIAIIDFQIGGGSLEKDGKKVIVFPQYSNQNKQERPFVYPNTEPVIKPERISEKFEQILRANGICRRSLCEGLPKIGIRNLEDCADLKPEQIIGFWGIKEKAAQWICERIKHVYEVEEWAREQREKQGIEN